MPTHIRNGVHFRSALDDSAVANARDYFHEASGHAHHEPKLSAHALHTQSAERRVAVILGHFNDRGASPDCIQCV